MEARITGVEEYYRGSAESFLLFFVGFTQAPIEAGLAELITLELEGNEALAGETVQFQGNPFLARYPRRAEELYATVVDRARELLAQNELLAVELAEEPEWLKGAGAGCRGDCDYRGALGRCS